MQDYDRTRVTAAVLGASLAAALLFVGACSDNGSDAVTPSAGSGAGAGAGSPSAAGSGGAGAGAAGKAGTGAAGSSPTNSGAAGQAGAAGSSSGAGAGGSSGAGNAGVSGSAGAAGAAGASGMDAPGTARPPATSLMLPTVSERPNVAPWFTVHRPMDLSSTGEPLPVVVWANGGCFRSDFTWEPLFKRWAAGGFVVLALTDGPDGPLATSSVEDHGALVDWALAEADKAGSMFAGKLDKERIVATGNSCGGVTALGVAAEDERVAAVFVLSGSSALASTDTRVMSAIKVPIGYVVGSMAEDIAAPNALADYEAMADGVPGMIVNRSAGDHITVSTDTDVLADVAEIALNWMDLALYGTPEAADALTSPKVCASCDAGPWMLKEKHLSTLRR